MILEEETYKKFGWKAIFIWETDLKRYDAEEFVLNQIRLSEVKK